MCILLGYEKTAVNCQEVCMQLVSAAFLSPGLNVDVEGKDGEEGGLTGKKEGAVAGGGVTGDGINVTAGWPWTADLGILSVSEPLSGFQLLEEALAAD